MALTEIVQTRIDPSLRRRLAVWLAARGGSPSEAYALRIALEQLLQHTPDPMQKPKPANTKRRATRGK